MGKCHLAMHLREIAEENTTLCKKHDGPTATGWEIVIGGTIFSKALKKNSQQMK